MIINKYLLNKLEINNNLVKLKFSENILNEIITNRLGKPTTKDEIKYYKNKFSKLSPLIFNKLKPKVKLISKANNYDQFPNTNLPEICVYGSYNVGKSTLINSILNKPNLCRTNVKTNHLHFYQVDKPGKLLLVDMPGYYIYNNKTDESKINENESKIIELCLSYIKYRTNLVLIIILIDSIKGICKEDLKVINYCNHNKLKFIIVLNKCDLVKPIELTKKLQIMNNQLNIFKYQLNNIIPISSIKLQNLNNLRDLLYDFINNNNLIIDTNEKLTKGETNSKLEVKNNKFNDINTKFNSITPDNNDKFLLKDDNFNDNKMNIKLNIDENNNLIKLNIDNSTIINNNNTLDINKLDKNETNNKIEFNNNLIDEKNELFNRRLLHHLSVKYKVSKFKINKSYKRVFSLYKTKLLNNYLFSNKINKS